MNIDDMTIGEVKQIASLLSSDKAHGLNDMIGRKCIVRTHTAGVWFGVIEKKDGDEVIVSKARRLWLWKAKQGISLSAVATYGIDQVESKITEPVTVWLQAIELIPASEDAISSIEGAANAKAR